MRNRYNQDYRLLEEFREDGRIRTDYEYIGKPYRFQKARGEVEKAKKRALTAAALAVFAYIAAMIPYSFAMHRLWIALPFAAQIVPLFLMLELLTGMPAGKETLERREAERGNNRYPALAVILCFFSGAALFGDLIRILTERTAAAGDAVFTVCLTGILAAGTAMFRTRQYFAAEEVF